MTTEYTDRGAAVSEAASSGLSMVYSLDEKGNPIAARGTGNEWTESRTYDEHDRVMRTVRPDGMRAEYAYADDGSCTFEMFDGSGSQLAKSVYAAEGNWLFSEYYWEGGGLQARYDYEGGFLSHATFYDENGCISRMYAPWASAEKREEFRSQYGAVPNEDNVFDIHYEYQRIDDPTSYVRLQKQGNNA